MRLLILGGTGFVGRQLAEAALAARHEVTVFHRGRSNPKILPNAEHVLGDRTQDLGKLTGRRFDVVFDTSGYEVPHVRAAARLARGSHYVFVSSISVYSDLAQATESGPVRILENAENASLTVETYGGLKAACERALDEELSGQVHCVRAGLILGPHDYDGRFRYWLERIARGGDVLAPGDPAALTQYVDVRDLVAWMLRAATARRTGIDNVTGEPIQLGELLETVRHALRSPARLRWVPDDILMQHAVEPYSEMPFWLPATLGARPVDIRRAKSAGLRLRPFEETVRDTWSWLADGWDAERDVRADRPFKVTAGISAEREAAILASLDRALVTASAGDL